MKLPHLLEEFIAAALASACLGVLVAVAYWWFTGLSPWPVLILAEIVGFGWGAAMLAISSPRRSD